MEDLNFKINTKNILKFTIPTIMSMLMMSIMGTIDGIFIARLIDVMALAAQNIAMPLVTATIALGSMISAGGSALIGKKIGQGKVQEARENFSLIVLFSFIASLLLCIVVVIFIDPLLLWMGANDVLLDMSREYIIPIVLFMPILITGFIFQQILIVNGQPVLSMVIGLVGGIANSIFNYIFLAVFDLGLFGAAFATIIGYAIPSILGLYIFTFKKDKDIYFVKPKLDIPAIKLSMSNGISEFISMSAVSVTTVLMNNITMDIEGPIGVAAVSIMMAIQFLIMSLFMGYSFGVAPLFSYHYGREDKDSLKKLFSLSMKLTIGMSVLTILIGLIFARELAMIYVSIDSPVFDLAIYGIRIISISFIFVAINIFASAMYTALNDGKTSGILSFFRTLVFLSIATIALPRILYMDGIWIATPVAELLALGMSLYYFNKLKSVYNYA